MLSFLSSFILLSPSKTAFASIIKSLETIFPLRTPPFNNSILSHTASPSKSPFIISLDASILPENFPFFPIITMFLEFTSPIISPSTCSLDWQLNTPSTFAPLAMIVVSESDIDN